MKFRLFCMFIVCLNYNYTIAQLTINIQSQTTADSIVKNKFITNGSGNISNVTLSVAFPKRFATFAGISNLGIDSGIVLSTGNTTNIPNPASSQIDDGFNCGASFPPYLCPDAELQTLIPAYPVNDVTTLMFGFQPVTDTIKFQYVFASEEYPEFVCNFTDVFGFFVNGTKPGGGNYINKNVALIPGTSLPVSVNSVNPGTPGTSSGGGTCAILGQSLAYSNYYVNNTGSSVIFDGFTTVLDITIPVVVLDTYQIKLGICNAKDGVFESAVFLRDNTFGGNYPRIAISAAPGIKVSNDSVYVCTGAMATFSSPKAVAYSWITGQNTQSITLSAFPSPQPIYCLLSNPVVAAQYMMGPVYLIADNSCVVGLNEMNEDAGINVNYNISNNEVIIKSKRELQEGTFVKLYNVAGSEVLGIRTGNSSREITIPSQSLHPGLYIIHLYNKEINLVKRFVKL